jgi:hypothetical protein
MARRLTLRLLFIQEEDNRLSTVKIGRSIRLSGTRKVELDERRHATGVFSCAGWPFGCKLAASDGEESPLGSKSSRVRSYAAAMRSGDVHIGMAYDLADRYAGPLVEISNPSSPATEPRLQLEECRSLSSRTFRTLVAKTASSIGVEPRALAVSVLLQLPRVASHDGWIAGWQVQHEVRTSALRLRSDTQAVRIHLPMETFELHDLIFEQIPSSRAIPMLTSLHYLRSARPDSLYFALVDPIRSLPVSLCSVSPLAWKRLANRISAQFAIRIGQVWEVSRMYSVNGSPQNAISSLLSKVRTYLRRNVPSVDLLVTTVDPNLGFTGCSYRAANWQEWITVKARPYFYEDCQYVSPRQLRERYGTSSLIELRAQHPGRFEQSRAKLLDSMIFCVSVNGETKVVPAPERHRLRR